MTQPERNGLGESQPSDKELDCNSAVNCACGGEPFDGENIICPNIAAFATLLAEELIPTDIILTDTSDA
jgi:hypothetical protein